MHSSIPLNFVPIPDDMPRPNDSPDVATSKTLAYILRHGAEKESLHIRSDGYIKLNDVVGPPSCRYLSPMAWQLGFRIGVS